MKPLDSRSKMMPPGRIVLLTLCAVLAGTDLTSGFIIRRPDGQCPPTVPGKPGIHCIPARNLCKDSNDCDWNKKCCSNGCVKLCMSVSSGLPPVPTEPPLFGPFRPPPKPHIPFPYEPPNPIPERPRLPPILFPPMDPSRYEPDDYLPIFPRYDDFP
ncbi:leucine-rich repeat extensin-like protein 6 [Bufo gargarizans]|uniref:leucine-rich repeat extensin-like protein 6 n=1 Tax=Bufo gargarizans TaxID=30331 RepID=UPI001CF29E46|nr:leucine-rich repeat extensin-like protein 6 [Bufo gargarizans]